MTLLRSIISAIAPIVLNKVLTYLASMVVRAGNVYLKHSSHSAITEHDCEYHNNKTRQKVNSD